MLPLLLFAQLLAGAPTLLKEFDLQLLLLIIPAARVTVLGSKVRAKYRELALVQGTRKSLQEILHWLCNNLLLSHVFTFYQLRVAFVAYAIWFE